MIEIERGLENEGKKHREIRNVMKEIAGIEGLDELSEKERASCAAKLFQAAAAKQGIELKLKKKPGKKK